MAYPKIFVGGKELKDYTITQDENGPYHKGIAALASLGGGLQYPLDFACGLGLAVTANTACKVVQQGTGLGNYIAVDFGEYQACFVHVNKHASGTIAAGKPICYIAPTSENGGYAVHLHIYAKRNYRDFYVREMLFAAPSFTIGTYVTFTTPTNIRQGNGINYPIVKTAAVNSVWKLKDGPRTGDGYNWYDVIEVGSDGSLGGSGWAIDNYMSPTDFVPTPPEPPADPCKDVKAELAKCELQKKGLQDKVDEVKKIVC